MGVNIEYGDLVLVLRNKFRGHIFQVHQAANDWVMVNAPKHLAIRGSILLSRRDVCKVKYE